jgi:hypothetical protein
MMSDSIDSVLRMECLAVRHGYISLRPSKACTNRSLYVLYIMLKFQYYIYMHWLYSRPAGYLLLAQLILGQLAYIGNYLL